MKSDACVGTSSASNVGWKGIDLLSANKSASGMLRIIVKAIMLIGCWFIPRTALNAINLSKKTRDAITLRARCVPMSFAGYVWVHGRVTLSRLVATTIATSLRRRR